MKIATDLEQSKKLAEFLPKESADMYYTDADIASFNEAPARIASTGNGADWGVPAWSLPALLELLRPFTLQTVPNGYFILVDKNDEHAFISEILDEPIDVCCSMIDNLHKRNLI